MSQTFSCKRLLLIEEDEIDIFVTEKILRSVNFAEHIEVMNFDIALISLLNGKDLPDYIFLSLYSRYKSGFDFLDELLHFPKEVRKIKVVVLSVSPFPADEKKALNYSQVVGYLQKPLTASSLTSLPNS